MPRPHFLPLRVEGRLEAVAQQLTDNHSASALIVSSSVNMRYLTGFTGSAGVLICRIDGSVLVTDGRYVEQAQAQIRDSGAAVRIAAWLIVRTQKRKKAIKKMCCLLPK